VKSEVEFSEEQLEGVRDMLYQRWVQGGPAAPNDLGPRDTRKEWAEGLSGEEARELLHICLKRGEWYVHQGSLPSKQGSQGVGDYQYTDAATSANCGGFVQFRA